MGGSNSKNSIFDEYPKNYIDNSRGEDIPVLDEKNWRIAVEKLKAFSDLHKDLTFSRVRASRSFPDRGTYEFVYQIIAVNKHHLRKKIVIRGVEELEGAEWFYSEYISNGLRKPKYDRFNFQAVVYAIIEDNGFRKLNFEDTNVYGKSTTVLTTGESLEVPVQTIKEGAPLLAKYIEKKKPNPKLSSCSEEFFQVFHGVHVQLEIDEIKTLLQFSAKFQVLNVKRYCEQQLIRRKDLKVSAKRKFKMACKYDLNILMNQVLRNVKTVKKLAKLASIAIEMESMDSNISKLLIAKMYRI
ncbi:unnamed protein product [Caenorhabditis brenneri]